MKAVSLWQPWASAVAVGAKQIETRSWATNYRGPLAIHAAKRCVKSELNRQVFSRYWQAALSDVLKPDIAIWDVLPFGAIVAVCCLADCKPVESFQRRALLKSRYPRNLPPEYRWSEWHMGNFEPGRFGWVLDGVRRLKTPIPCVGRQGFFHVSDGICLAD